MQRIRCLYENLVCNAKGFRSSQCVYRLTYPEVPEELKTLVHGEVYYLIMEKFTDLFKLALHY